MLREGLEAILIVGALMTFLVKMGAAHRKPRHPHRRQRGDRRQSADRVALETVFVLSAAHREALEGGTMVVATAVLFYVSYWLLSKMEVVKWNKFVKSKVQDALDSGSALALASAAFLAVYREGFETVLFYKALFVAGTAGGTMPVVGGILAGSVVLVGGLHRDQPLRRAAAAQAVLRGHERVPLLHGVRVRREGHRRAAGRRARRHHDPLVGAAHSGARHLPDRRIARRPGAAAPARAGGAGVELRARAAPRARGDLGDGAGADAVPASPVAAAPRRRPRSGCRAGARSAPARWSSCSARSSAWRPTWPRCGPRSSGCGGTWSPTPSLPVQPRPPR